MNRITIFILLISSHFSFGQSLQSHISESRVLDETLNHALIGSINNRLVSLSEKKDQLNIDIYNADSLNLLFREEIRFVENEKFNLEIQGIYRVKDQFKLVATGFSNGSYQFGIFIYTIEENGKLSTHFQRTLFTDKVSENLSVNINIETNPEQTLLMIHAAFANTYGGYVDHHVRVFDEKLTNVFKTDYVSFPLSTGQAKHDLSYCLGNKHVYELNREVVYDKSIKKYQTTLQFRKFDFKGVETTYTQRIKVADGFMIDDVDMQEQREELRLTASYLGSSKKKITGIRGVYTAKFNPDLSIKYTNTKAFSATTKAKSLKGYENAYELDVPLLYGLNNCLEDSKGNTYLLYERKSHNSIAGMSEFYYGSIIAIKINSEGIVEWDTFIAKSQFFQERAAPIPFIMPNVGFALFFSIRFSKDSRQYLSFKPILKNDELYLLYNDNPKNEGRTAEQERENLTNINQSVPFIIHLSSNGNVAYQMLKNLKIESENQRIVYSLSNGTTLFTLRDSGKKEVLQRIEFE